jgi:trehalose/maltose hydrolase-like predicted phosphorylase
VSFASGAASFFFLLVSILVVGPVSFAQTKLDLPLLESMKNVIHYRSGPTCFKDLASHFGVFWPETITLCLELGFFGPGAQASGNEEKGTASAAAQADSFQFSTRNYTNYLPVFLSNGFLFGATTWNGTSAGAATLAGLYDHLQQDSYPYQALIPSWSEVDFFNGSHWLNQVREMQVEGYDQQLDGLHALLRTHYRWIDSSDSIVIHGDVEAQRVVHAALYYLLSSFREGVTWSVPAMALPSRAYLGRIWWDDDTWIFPSLVVLHPELARSVVAYRFKMLAGAKRNAEGRGKQ